MKTQKIKTLSWLSGLFLLSMFLISPDAVAQKNKGNKGKKGMEKHPGYGHAPDDYYYHDDYYYDDQFYASGNGYGGHQGNHYGQHRPNPRNNGSCGTPAPSYRVYNNRGNGRFNGNGNHRMPPVRIGTELNRLPPRARPVWIRGKKFYTARGFLWRQFRTPRGRTFFRAVDRVR